MSRRPLYLASRYLAFVLKHDGGLQQHNIYRALAQACMYSVDFATRP
jgi:hypothetical protein